MKSSDTIFTKQEFDEIVEFCKEHNLDLEITIGALSVLGLPLSYVFNALEPKVGPPGHTLSQVKK